MQQVAEQRALKAFVSNAANTTSLAPHFAHRRRFTFLSIAVTRIKISSAGEKRGKVELPKRLKFELYMCEFLKVLTVLVLAYSAISKNAQIIRMYTVFQIFACSMFYYFGGKMIANILTPKVSAS